MILLTLFTADQDRPRMTSNLLRTCTAPHVVVFHAFISLDSGGGAGGKAEQEDATFKANKRVIAGKCAHEEEDVIHQRRIWRFEHQAEERKEMSFSSSQGCSGTEESTVK